MLALRRIRRVPAVGGLKSRCMSAMPDDEASRLIRFVSQRDGNEHYGALCEDGVTAKVHQRGPTGALQISEDVHQVDSFLPPLEPTAVYGVGLNYREHAKETGLASDERKHPTVFMKAASSVVGHEQLIVIPRVCGPRPEVDFEGELAVVIGRPARDVSPDAALQHVLGYTIANDVSARRWQGNKRGGGQWTRAKSFDSFCPLGPFLVPAARLGSDPQSLTIETRVNGQLMQQANTNDMVHSVAELIAFLSEGTTLSPGTVVLTGTPAGVGYAREPPVYLKRGDVVEVAISGLGTLRNRVAEEVESDDGSVELRV